MNNKKIVEKYELQRVLGAGQFGKVYLAQHVETKEFVAIKQILIKSLSQHDGLVGQLLANEINFLAEIDNENVIKLIRYIQTLNNVYIVMELCEDGDLETYWINKKMHISENEALGIFKQILNGLISLHERNIVHRDLKMANILMAKGGIVKVADLGFSARMKSENDQLSLVLGSPGTMAPEVASYQNYGLKADIFSLGVILYQLIFGEFPYECPTFNIFLQNVRTKVLTFKVQKVSISQQLQKMLQGMLEPDQFKRISFTELYQQLLAFPISAQQQQNNKKLEINSQFYKNRQIKQLPIGEQQVQIQRNICQNGLFQTQQIGQLPVYIPDTMDVIINQFLDLNITECSINNEVTKYKDTFNAILYIQCTLKEVQNLNNQFDTKLLQFVLVKTILIELQKLLTLTQVHRNIFNTKQLDEVYSNPEFDALLNQMVEVEIQEKSKFQQLQNIVTLQIPTLQRQFTQQLLKVINSEHDQQFHQNYREIVKIYTQQILEQYQQYPQIESYVQVYHLFFCTHFQYIVTQRLNIKEEFQDIRKKSVDEIEKLMAAHKQRIYNIQY